MRRWLGLFLFCLPFWALCEGEEESHLDYLNVTFINKVEIAEFYIKHFSQEDYDRLPAYYWALNSRGFIESEMIRFYPVNYSFAGEMMVQRMASHQDLLDPNGKEYERLELQLDRCWAFREEGLVDVYDKDFRLLKAGFESLKCIYPKTTEALSWRWAATAEGLGVLGDDLEWKVKPQFSDYSSHLRGFVFDQDLHGNWRVSKKEVLQGGEDRERGDNCLVIWGLMNAGCELIVPVEYESITAVPSGYLAVKDGQTTLFDRQGTERFRFEKHCRVHAELANDTFLVTWKANRENCSENSFETLGDNRAGCNKAFLICVNEKRVVNVELADWPSASFDDFEWLVGRELEKGARDEALSKLEILPAKADASDSKYVYFMDLNGKQILPAEFESVTLTGSACFPYLCTRWEKKSDLTWQFSVVMLSHVGELKIVYAEEFPTARLKTIAKKNSYCGSEELSETPYTGYWVTFSELNSGLFFVHGNNKNWLVNTQTGRVLTPNGNEIDEVSYFVDGVGTVRKGDQYALIDSDGKQLSPWFDDRVPYYVDKGDFVWLDLETHSLFLATVEGKFSAPFDTEFIGREIEYPQNPHALKLADPEFYHVKVDGELKYYSRDGHLLSQETLESYYQGKSNWLKGMTNWYKWPFKQATIRPQVPYENRFTPSDYVTRKLKAMVPTLKELLDTHRQALADLLALAKSGDSFPMLVKVTQPSFSGDLDLMEEEQLLGEILWLTGRSLNPEVYEARLNKDAPVSNGYRGFPKLINSDYPWTVLNEPLADLLINRWLVHKPKLRDELGQAILNGVPDEQLAKYKSVIWERFSRATESYLLKVMVRLPLTAEEGKQLYQKLYYPPSDVIGDMRGILAETIFRYYREEYRNGSAFILFGIQNEEDLFKYVNLISKKDVQACIRSLENGKIHESHFGFPGDKKSITRYWALRALRLRLPWEPVLRKADGVLALEEKTPEGKASALAYYAELQVWAKAKYDIELKDLVPEETPFVFQDPNPPEPEKDDYWGDFDDGGFSDGEDPFGEDFGGSDVNLFEEDSFEGEPFGE